MATNKQKFKELFPGVWEFLYENLKKETSSASKLQTWKWNYLYSDTNEFKISTLFDAIYFRVMLMMLDKLQLDTIKFFGDSV
jgi:hypothetical protein